MKRKRTKRLWKIPAFLVDESSYAPLTNTAPRKGRIFLGFISVPTRLFAGKQKKLKGIRIWDSQKLHLSRGNVFFLYVSGMGNHEHFEVRHWFRFTNDVKFFIIANRCLLVCLVLIFYCKGKNITMSKSDTIDGAMNHRSFFISGPSINNSAKIGRKTKSRLFVLLPILTWFSCFLRVSAGIWISAFQVSLHLFAVSRWKIVSWDEITLVTVTNTHSRNYYDDGRDFHSLFFLFNFQALNQG